MALGAKVDVGGGGFIKPGGTAGIAQWKQFFFDRPAVMRAVGKGKAVALNRFAGFVRQVARRSMRRRKNGSSRPGQPPFAKSGEIRDFVLYAWDPKTGTVIVGPLGFKGSGVPALHEHGGTVSANGRVMLVKRKAGRNSRGQFVSRGVDRVKLSGMLEYPKRPYMAPALTKSIPKFAESFRGTIHR